MKRMNDAYDNSGFFYMAGISVGRFYGEAPTEFRNKVVSKFKEWIDSKYGSDPLPTNQQAVNRVVQQFILEFERYQRREPRGRQRH